MAIPRTPRVSVIVPIFNSQEFLHETLDSVVQQTLDPEAVEVILIDDGSTDASGAIADEYAKRSALWSSLHIENSGGAAVPRNVGLDHATGDYVFFLDADDKFEPDALEHLIERADSTGSDVVLCRQGSFGERRRRLAVKVFERERFAEDFVESFAYRTLGPWKLFRRSLIDDHGLRFPTGFPNGEDLPFTIEAYLRANHVSALSSKPYYWFRGRAGTENVSARQQSVAQDYLKNAEVIGRVQLLEEDPQRRLTLLRRSFIDAAGLQLVFGQRFHTIERAEQDRLVDDFATRFGHLWSEELRALATNEVKVMLDLAAAGQTRELDRFSRSLAAGEQLTLMVESDGGEPSYASSVTQRHRNMVPNVATVLVGLERAPSGEISAAVRFGLRGAVLEGSALTAQFVWRHRPSKTNYLVPTEQRRETDVEHVATAVISNGRRFPRPGTWDLFLRVSLGSWRHDHRIGAQRTAEVAWGTVDIRHIRRTRLFFTEYENVSVEQESVRMAVLRYRAYLRSLRRRVLRRH